MAGRGGKRPGAGRPPKHVVHQSHIRVAEAKIRDRLPWLVDKLIELADGIHEERMMGENAVIVYKRPPDRQAVEYLMDRVLGKTVARTEQGDPGAFDLDLSGFDADELRAAFKVVKSA